MSTDGLTEIGLTKLQRVSMWGVDARYPAGSTRAQLVLTSEVISVATLEMRMTERI